MSANTYYLELINKTMKTENLFLKKKEVLEKKLGCKFTRINTSNAKKGFDTDYELGKIQIFISNFKEKRKKRTRRQNKKNKTSISKSKCISCKTYNQK